MFVLLVDIDRLPAFERNEVREASLSLDDHNHLVARKKTSMTKGIEAELFRVVQKTPSLLIVDDHLGQLQRYVPVNFKDMFFNCLAEKKPRQGSCQCTLRSESV